MCYTWCSTWVKQIACIRLAHCLCNRYCSVNIYGIELICNLYYKLMYTITTNSHQVHSQHKCNIICIKTVHVHCTWARFSARVHTQSTAHNPLHSDLNGHFLQRLNTQIQLLQYHISYKSIKVLVKYKIIVQGVATYLINIGCYWQHPPIRILYAS